MPVEIDRVRAALDPIGVIRDPAKNCCIDLGVINERIGLFGAHPAINSSIHQNRAAKRLLSFSKVYASNI